MPAGCFGQDMAKGLARGRFFGDGNRQNPLTRIGRGIDVQFLPGDGDRHPGGYGAPNPALNGNISLRKKGGKLVRPMGKTSGAELAAEKGHGGYFWRLQRGRG